MLSFQFQNRYIILTSTKCKYRYHVASHYLKYLYQINEIHDKNQQHQLPIRNVIRRQ